ncbi:MAG: acyl-CoA thioesterase [Arenicella sp.]|jgi:acyl-CoA thioesterase
MTENKNSFLEIAERASAHMHSTDYCAQMLGIEVQKVAPGYAELTMTVRPEFANGHGMCQGGLISTLADTAFAHACNSCNRKTVAQRFSIDFIRPANVGEKLVAVAEQQSRGKLTGIYQVNVTNSNQKLVAIFNGSSFEVGGAVLA